jgi:hypothetical protein
MSVPKAEERIRARKRRWEASGPDKYPKPRFSEAPKHVNTASTQFSRLIRYNCAHLHLRQVRKRMQVLKRVCGQGGRLTSRTS